MKQVFNPLSGNFDTVLSAASELPYDNGSSGLAATDVQDAIDEVQAEIAAIPDPIYYAGTWSAATNTPTLANTDVGAQGRLYQVNAAGSVNFGAGAISFEIGDKVVNNGSTWDKWDMTDAVSSVNGATGAVTINAINQLTGDITAGPASGSASAAATLATVNSNVGSFGSASSVASVTVNAKGLTTAASSTAIQIAESQVTNLVSDLSGKEPTITQLPINKGGTNSVAALNNNRVMQSSDGAIVEAAAITASRALASNVNGIPVAATTTAAELDFVSGSRSSLQTQIDANSAKSVRTLNWITNYGVEVNTTGYATYADAAATTPVDGTGGSPNVTIARNTSSPLDGTADLEFVKDAANRQGQGFSYDFTIDSAYQGTVQQFNFNYKILSGTYASGDVTLWIYDVTNAVLISQPSGNSIISTAVNSQQGQCTFQTAINSTSYRAIWHVTTTSASAYTLRFDNISIGPQILNMGFPAQDNTAWTPTVGASTTGLGTISAASAVYTRAGQMLIAEGVFTCGTTTTTTGALALPTGLKLATASLVTNNASNAAGDLIGRYTTNNANANTGFGQIVTAPATSDSAIWFCIDSSNSASKIVPSQAISTNTFPTGTVVRFKFEVPIAGWSSNTVMSESANTRVVTFEAFKNGGSAFTADTAIPTWTTVNKDSVAGFDSSTGIYTVKVPGDYFVSWTYRQTASAAGSAAILVNGSSVRYGVSNASVDSKQVTGLLVNLKVNDTIAVSASVGATLSSIDALNHWAMFLINGPQQIAASESVNARYFACATTITGSFTTMTYTTKDYDSHNAYSSGTYTVPAPGKYNIKARLTSSAAVGAANNAVGVSIFKNGSEVSTMYITEPTVSTINFDALVVDDINCVAGDLITIRGLDTRTTPVVLSSSTRNYFSIVRVGN